MDMEYQSITNVNELESCNTNTDDITIINNLNLSSTSYLNIGGISVPAMDLTMINNNYSAVVEVEHKILLERAANEIIELKKELVGIKEKLDKILLWQQV